MKKLLVVAALMLGLIIGQAAQVEAATEDYLGEWEGGWKAYLVVSSLDMIKPASRESPYFRVGCVVKAVSSSGTVKNIDYVMDISVDDNPLVAFKDSLGGNGQFYINSPGHYLVEQRLATHIMGNAINLTKRGRNFMIVRKGLL